MTDAGFRRDLYRGTARYYDRYRIPYPRSLITDLAERCQVRGDGRLLDLACGTGQLSFALCRRFAEVWAVDQEPEMIDLAARKTAPAGAGRVRFAVGTAEDAPVPDGHFDVIVIGNAFHRLDRETVAARALRWLRPGGYLALVWGRSPWDGEQPWQRALGATMRHWRARVGDRVPRSAELARRDLPDLAVLRQAGFEVTGSYRFAVAHEWSTGELIGFLYSTSVLSRPALGSRAPAFEEELRAALLTCQPDGRLRETIDFAYDLARAPAPAAGAQTSSDPCRTSHKPSRDGDAR